MYREGILITENRKLIDALVYLIQSAMIAALYLVLTLMSSFMSFGILQFRAAEALTALPVLFPSAIPGVFAGCLLSNVLNPSPLGVVDIAAGSLTTLLSAYLTWKLGASWRRSLLSGAEQKKCEGKRPFFTVFRMNIVPMLPPILLNALIVGTYLPFLLTPGAVTFGVVAGSCGLILLSESVVVLALGLPLVKALEKTPWALRNCRSGK